MTSIRTVAGGHLFRSEDGQRPVLQDGNEHTFIDCELCYHDVCIHDGDEAVAKFLTELCYFYEPELPGLEVPVVPQPERTQTK